MAMQTKYGGLIGHGSVARPGVGPGIPDMAFVIIMPDWLRSSVALERLHAKASKEAAREVMLIHWKKRIPGHFKAPARAKYQHHARAAVTKFRKMKHHRGRTDLVKTSKTQNRMTREVPTIRVGGKASDVLRVSMTMGFGFPVTFQPSKPQSVTPQKMALEISRWTDAEMTEAAKQYRDAYVAAFERLTANSPVLRQRIGGALNAIRNV